MANISDVITEGAALPVALLSDCDTWTVGDRLLLESCRSFEWHLRRIISPSLTFVIVVMKLASTEIGALLDDVSSTSSRWLERLPNLSCSDVISENERLIGSMLFSR